MSWTGAGRPSRPDDARARRSPAVLAAALVFCVALSGCNQFVLLSYIIGGPPSIEPDFDAQTGKSLDKPEVTAAVICYAGTDLKVKNPKIDLEVSSMVAYQLAANDIKVVHPDTVNAWLDEHRDWEKAEEVGQALKANYVIEIELEEFSLYERNSASLFRGRAEGYVNVYELDEHGRGERIYSKDLSFVYPTEVPRSTFDHTHTAFKRDYLAQLSQLIAWLFTERYSGDKMHWAS
jgi:hypothetical protein